MSRLTKGTLPSSAPYLVSVADFSCPFTVCLSSAAAARSIEVSPNGVDFETGVPDKISPTFLMLIVKAPATHIRFNGAANDAWSIL